MAHYDEQEEALQKEIDAMLDFDVPDVDIQYQEDDGNSNCDGGGCTI